MFDLNLPFTNPVAVFAVLIGLILIVPLIFKPLRIPVVAGLILGGLLIGPHGLGLLVRGETPQLLGKIGIIYIMFLAGLEIDLHQLSKRKGQTILFGVLTFLVPLGMGFAGAFGLFGMAAVPALLLASMFSSHTLLTYPEISRFGLSRNRAVTVTIGGTMITNLCALLILALSATWAQGKLDQWYFVRLAISLLIYCVVVFAVIPFMARRALKSLSADGDIQFLLIFCIMFISAALAQPAGLEPVIGAFLIGIALNRLIPDSSVLMNRLNFVGNSLFIPLFLVDVGLIINPSQFFGNIQSWFFAAFMVFVAIVSKWIPAWVSQKAFKFSPAERGIIFGLSVNQAASTLAAVLVGRELGLFDDIVVTATVVMILVSCIVGSVVSERSARKLKMAFASVSHDEKEESIRLMVSLSNPETAPALAELATYLVPKNSSEAIYPTVMVQDGTHVEEDLAKAESVIALAMTRILPLGLKAIPVSSLDVNIASGLLRVSKARRIQVMLLGWNGHFGVGRALFGSILDQLISNSPLRLVVARLFGSISEVKRVVLILPPFIEHQQDIWPSLGIVFDLAKRLGLKILLLSQALTLDNLSKNIKGLHQSLETVELKDWSDLLPSMTKLSNKTDLIALAHVRKHQLAWRPSLDRLPKSLSETFLDNNLLIVYPGTKPDTKRQHSIADDLSDNASHYDSPADQAPISYARYFERTSKPEQAILEVLAQQFDEHKAFRLLHTFSPDGKLQGVELKPGVILLHHHDENVEQFWIGCAVYSDLGRPIDSENPIDCIVLLVSPAQKAAEEHLVVLSRIARWVGQDDFKKTITSLCTSFS